MQVAFPQWQRRYDHNYSNIIMANTSSVSCNTLIMQCQCNKEQTSGEGTVAIIGLQKVVSILWQLWNGIA